jgi:hypothetical protein
MADGKTLPNGKTGFPPGHYYNPNKPSAAQNTKLKAGGDDAWTPPTYYVYPYKAHFRLAAGQRATIMTRLYDPQTHRVVSETPETVTSATPLVRPAGSYISVKSAMAFDIDADKDF